MKDIVNELITPEADQKKPILAKAQVRRWAFR